MLRKLVHISLESYLRFISLGHKYMSVNFYSWLPDKNNLANVFLPSPQCWAAGSSSLIQMTMF